MLSVIINNSDKPCAPQIKSQYELPENWYVIADDEKASDKLLYRFERDMVLAPRSSLIIVDAGSYDKINGTDFSKPVSYCIDKTTAFFTSKKKQHEENNFNRRDGFGHI